MANIVEKVVSWFKPAPQPVTTPAKTIPTIKPTPTPSPTPTYSPAKSTAVGSDTPITEKQIPASFERPEVLAAAKAPQPTWQPKYEGGSLKGFTKGESFIPTGAVPRSEKGVYQLERIGETTKTSTYVGGTTSTGEKLAAGTPVQVTTFKDISTGRPLAQQTKLGETVQIMDVRPRTLAEVRKEQQLEQPSQFSTFTGKLSAAKPTQEGFTEDRLKKEQEDLRKQVSDIVGKSLTYNEAERLVQESLKQQTKTTVKPISKGKQMILDWIVGKAAGVPTKPVGVEVAKETGKAISDVWKSSPLSLYRVWWRETGTPSGARTPAQLQQNLLKTIAQMSLPKTKAELSKIDLTTGIPLPALTLGKLQIAGIQEARAQRAAGEELPKQQKYITEEYKKLQTEFEKKYPTDKKIEDLQTWENYKKDYIDFVTKQRALGFYQPDEKTLINPVLDKPNVPMYYKQVQAVKEKYGDKDWRVRGYQAGRILGDVGEAAIIGAITSGTGAAGVIGRGTSHLLGGSKFLATELGLALTGIAVSSDVAKGYTSYKSLGLSGKEGAIEGAIAGLGKVGGFVVGASGGKLSPVKYQEFGGTEEGTKRIREISAFGKPIAVWQEGQKGSLSLFHYPKSNKLDFTFLQNDVGFEPMSKTEANFLKHYVTTAQKQLATEGITMDKGIKIMKQLYNTQLHDTPNIDFSKSRAFQELKPEQQEVFKNWLLDQAKSTKGLQGFENALTNKGLERVYGSSTISAEKGFETNLMRKNGEYGDFDINFRDTAKDKAQALANLLKETGYKNIRLQPDTSLIEVKSGKEWIHLADLHGADNPELMLKGSPWGFESQAPKTFKVEGAAIPGQKLGQSLTEKGGSLLTAHMSEQGNIYFAPQAHRMKDVADFVSVAERLNLEKSQGVVDKLLGLGETRTKNIEQLKNILKVNFPDVKFEGTPYEQVFAKMTTPAPSLALTPALVTPSIKGYAVSPKFEVTPSESQRRMETSWEVFLPKEAKATPSKFIDTATFGAFEPVSRAPSPSATMPSFVSTMSATPSVSLVSPSVSPSISMSRTGSVSISPSPSVSPSVSPSPSVSVSPSFYPSVSPSPSVSVSPSGSVSVSPSPSATPSPYPQAQMVPPPLITFGWGGGGEVRKPKGKAKKRAIYAPDFTAKALGISIGKQSNEQLKKLLKQTFTGLEIRGIPQ